MIPTSDLLPRLLEKARQTGADRADAVMAESVDISAARRMGRPEGLERSESRAVGLRVFVGQRQATASSTDTLPAALHELAERAVAMAKAAPADPDAVLAPDDLLAREFPALELCDAMEPDPQWLDEQCRIAEEAALAENGVTNSEGAEAHYGKSALTLAMADGRGVYFAESYPSSHFSLSVSVLAGEGTGMERDWDFTAAHHRADMMKAETVGKKAAQRAVARLHARKAKSCRVPVVFEPRAARGLAGIFAGAISGNAVTRGSSFLKDAMGQEIFAPHVSIIDDPYLKRGLGSRPFDGEGVRGKRLALVEKGTLKSWLLDMRTAHRLGMPTTGHAARGVGGPPSPAATNLYIENGDRSPRELMHDIKSGFYVTETFGMGVNLTTGDYSQGASGFWIENGEIAWPVSEITIAGHLSEMFRSATPANDLEFRYSANAPTLRVEAMTVAGA